MKDKAPIFLAFDIGATSGRAVVAEFDGDRLATREIHRFPNEILEIQGRSYWNVYRIYEELRQALMVCAREGLRIASIGIDTWGVDFGCVAKDGTLLGLPRAYRDPFTNGAPEAFFRKIPRETVYGKTGIQVMDFNTLYQLDRMVAEGYEPLAHASDLLFMPDLLSYLLTGNRVCEYTDASTSQLLDATTRRFDPELLAAVGVESGLFPQLVLPGTTVGYLSDGLARETGLGKVKVVAVAGHDTASAVAAVPALDQEFAYLSSGTWSLMGIETEKPIITDRSFDRNFTNEGGIDGTIRFLKNITGMWLIERCRAEWRKDGRDYSYEAITKMMADGIGATAWVDPNDPRFSNPASMTGAIVDYCRMTGQPCPESDSQFVRCVFESLAFSYRRVLDDLKAMAPFPIRCLHIIGGGSRNRALNQLTANVIGLPVIAGPSEATALGNCLVQARAAGLAADRWAMRRMIRDHIGIESFYPEGKWTYWEKAYVHFREVTNQQNL